jgi:hypothetical protein
MLFDSLLGKPIVWMNGTERPEWLEAPVDEEARDRLMAQVYARVRELIAAGWTRGAPARDRYGHPVTPTHRSAARFCVLGAAERALHDLETAAALGLPPIVLDYEIVLGLQAACPDGWSPAHFNDHLARNKEEILAVIDKAAACYKK